MYLPTYCTPFKCVCMSSSLYLLSLHLPQVLELPKETFITALHWYPSQSGGAKRGGASELCALGTTNGEERREKGRRGGVWRREEERGEEGREGEERGGEETKGPITCYFVCTVQCRICTYARM